MSCGALSTDPMICSYCGSIVSDSTLTGDDIDTSRKVVSSVRKAVNRAIVNVKRSLKNEEFVELAFSNSFAFIKHARRVNMYVASTFFPLGIFLMLGIEFSWFPGFSYSSGLLYTLVPLIYSGLAIPIGSLPTIIYGIPPISQVYVITNHQLEIFSKRGRHLYSVPLSNIRTVVQVSSEAMEMDPVAFFTLMEKQIKNESILHRSGSLRSYIVRLRKQETSFKSISGLRNFYRTSIMFVSAERVAKIENVLRRMVMPKCQFYDYKTGSSRVVITAPSTV